MKTTIVFLAVYFVSIYSAPVPNDFNPQEGCVTYFAYLPPGDSYKKLEKKTCSFTKEDIGSDGTISIKYKFYETTHTFLLKEIDKSGVFHVSNYKVKCQR